MRNILACIGILLCCISCDTPAVWSESISLPGVWDKNEAITFTLTDLDSVTPYDVFINVRNTNDYPFNNLFIVAAIEFPHGKTITDTLEYKMAYPDGKWMGEGIGAIKENKLWFKEQIQFAESGNYNITITQAVRNNGEVEGVSQLPGITDVGISIEKAIQQP
ncbi:gliding motility lipoprotein GldH [Rasiella rasia]|uniref:Gliding motility lipoprotein GldH n=1 Tax=Rasiella rasia TaxID=2744027 RepID=A0A6G6GN09_9FLAO|nr:gliding motility lipoprotein GldH [Rasiella rasia]QIE59966.1 gliding motility lipoprotein GldH [Rasiella rasia]